MQDILDFPGQEAIALHECIFQAREKKSSWNESTSQKNTNVRWGMGAGLSS